MSFVGVPAGETEDCNNGDRLNPMLIPEPAGVLPVEALSPLTAGDWGVLMFVLWF